MGVFYNQMVVDKTEIEIEDILRTIYPTLRQEYEAHAEYMMRTGIFGLTSNKHKGIVSIYDYCNNIARYDSYL
jgi:hypothetical protein